MPVINVKGLPGLRSWRDLSSEEKQQWLNENPKARNASLYQVERAYETSQFINQFGSSAFHANDLQTRRQMMRDKVIGDKFTEIYGDEDDFEELNSMTTAGKEAALTRGLATHQEIADSAKDFAESVANTPKAVTGGITTASPMLARPEVLANPQKIEEQLTQGSGLFRTGEAGRQRLKQELLAEDNERKQASADALSRNYLSALHAGYNKGEVTANEIEDQFTQIVGGSKEPVVTEIPGIGEISTVLPKSRYYDAFKDARWFNDFSLDEKMETIARFTAMQQAYGLADAVESVDRNMQKRVAERQKWTRQLGNTALNIGSGAAAYIMQSLMAFESLGKLNDPEAYSNFMEGLDRDGNKLPDVWNVKYWDGVDQFGTFSPGQINEARERGGVSRMQLISNPGKEYNAWATLNEGLKMAKFIVPDLVLNGVIGKGLGAISKAAGAKFTPVGTLKPIGVGGSTRAGYTVAKYINPAVMAFRSGLGISQAYSTQTYDQTKEEADRLIDKQVDVDATAYAERALQTDAAKNAIAEYARAKTEELLRTNPGLTFGDIDQDAILKEGQEMFTSKAKQDYVLNKDLWTSNYDVDREEAKMQAASAAITDFIVEQIRMFAAGMTWKDYTFDKGTRQARIDNSLTKNIVNNTEGNLALANKHWTRVKPMVKAVWGGFESNYFDDVTVAFGKGFGLGKFNNYLAHKYNPEQDAETIDTLGEFFTGIDSAVRGAKGALSDFQSFYDGLVGALGTGVQVTPRLSALKKSNRENLRTDELGNPISIAETVNKLLYNPLLQSYSDARAQERVTQKNLDAINRAIKDHGSSINDALSLVGSDMDVINLIENVASAREIKDAKVRQAYTTALWLKKAMDDPIMSMHDGVRRAQETLDRFAQGNVTDADVTEFLGRVDNKSVADLPAEEAAKTARSRMKNNAQQLINLQRERDLILDDIKQSEYYTVLQDIEGSDVVTDDLVDQLAFMRIAGQDWTTRRSEMEKEVSGSPAVNTSRNRTALYGSRKGWERAKELAQKEVDAYQQDYNKYSELYERALKNSKKSGVHKDSPELLHLKLTADYAKIYLDVAKENLKQINSEEVRPDEVLPVLSKEEILGLRPEERAYMLRVKNNALENTSEYSKEQQAVIKEVVNDINMRDTSLWGKIQDIADLDNMIRDNQESYGRIIENPEAAVGMVRGLKENRQANVTNRILLRNWDRYDTYLESLANDEEFIREAKKGNESYLNRFLDKHPERRSVLSGVIEVSKLTADAAGIIDGLFESEEDQTKWKKLISDTLSDSGVVNRQTAMTALEELVDNIAFDNDKDSMNRVLQGLEDLKYQRDATVIFAREEAQKKAQEEEERKKYNADGKNFGFDGYTKDMLLYNVKTGAQYSVLGFAENEKGNTMEVRAVGNGKRRVFTADEAEKFFSKELPEKIRRARENKVLNDSLFGQEEQTEQQSVAPETTEEEVQKDEQSQTAVPESAAQQPLVEDSSAEQNDFTPEGAVKQGTEEEQQAIDASQANTNVVAPGVDDPYTSPATPYTQDTGTFPGHVLYEYDIAALTNDAVKRVQRRETNPALGKLLPQWFSWLDNNHIKLQEIIDYEFGRIIQDHPDTKVHFMKIHSSLGNELQSKVIVNVIELTDSLEKYHDKDRGGVIVVDGKNYLVVGTSGFQRNNTFQQTGFNRLNERLNGEASVYFGNNAEAEYYISGTYSEVSDMLNGKIANTLADDSEVVYRTLNELIQDPRRNPREYKGLQDLVYGVLYNSGLVLSKNMQGFKLYAPTNSRVGNTFVFVEAGNGAWVPIAIKTIDMTQLREGRLKEVLTENFNALLSNDVQARRDAAKRLFGKERGYLLGDDKNNILVGDEQHNNITVIKNGVPRTFDLATVDRVEFLNYVSDVPFIVKTRMSTFADIDRLEMYDEAGALMTNSALLGTVSQTYNMWEVGEDGKPVIKDEVTYPQSNIDIKAPRNYQATVLNGRTYRVTEEDRILHFYDPTGKEIPQTPENQGFIDNIWYNIVIQQRNLSPIKSTRGQGNYYILNEALDNPRAVYRSPDGNITVLDRDVSLRVVKRAETLREQAQREAAAKAEVERLRRNEEQTLDSAVMHADQAVSVPLGLEGEGTSIQQAPQVKAVPPITQAKEVVSTREEKQGVTSATDNTKGSLTELQSRARSTGENVNFATIWRYKYSVIIPEIERLTGKRPKNLLEAQKALDELGISTASMNMDTVEEILKNCR